MQQNPPKQERPETTIPNLGQVIPPESPFTRDEWLVLAETPVKIGRAMMAVSPSGVIGTTQEIMALRKSYTDALQTNTNPLIQNLRHQVQNQDTMQHMWDDAGHAFSDRWDSAHVRQIAIASCQQAIGLLRKASPQDAQAYRDFVYKTALNVAQAAKEGGFAGLGGVAVSVEEKSLLNDISKALGLQPS